MKNSDNVIRMGLTPKLKDLNVLPYILTNTLQPLNEIIPSNGVYSSENLHFRVIHEEASFEAKVLSIGIVVEGSF